MKFDLVKIFAGIYLCFAVTAKSENTFQLRQERSLNSEKDFKSAGELNKYLYSFKTVKAKVYSYSSHIRYYKNLCLLDLPDYFSYK